MPFDITARFLHVLSGEVFRCVRMALEACFKGAPLMAHTVCCSAASGLTRTAKNAGSKLSHSLARARLRYNCGLKSRNFPNCSSYKIMARADLRARITAAIHAIESGECADYTEAALKYGVDRTTIPALSSAMAELKHTSPKSPELSIRSVSGMALSPFYPKSLRSDASSFSSVIWGIHFRA
jgi:hypothetical protein